MLAAGRPGGRRRPILHVTRKLNQFFSYGYEIWHAHSSPQNTGLKEIWWLYSKNWAQKMLKSPFLGLRYSEIFENFRKLL